MTKQQQYDLKVLGIMIEQYCLDHHQRGMLCPDCTELLTYAHERIKRCPLGGEKRTCQSCTIHCYSPQRRRQIKEVMRYSGKRMLFTHPFIALRHLVILIKSKVHQ